MTEGQPRLSMLGFALRSLGRRRGRSLAVGGGLMACVAMLGAVFFLTDALRAEATKARVHAPDLVVQRLVGGRPALVPEAWRERIASRPGVSRVTPRVWGYLFLPSLQGNVTLVGLTGDAGALPPVALEQGRAPRGDERGACAVGRELAAKLGVRAGDRVRFPGPNDRGPVCSVVGVFSSAVDLFTSDVVLLNEADARAMLGLPEGEATDLAISLTTPDESRVLAGALADALPGSRILEKRLLERVHALSFGRRAGLVLGASLPALLALLVLAHDRASGLGASERREIAILKASGWSSAHILELKLYEALLLALVATGLGLLLGYAWVFALGAPGLREALAGWAVLYPALHLTPQVTFAQLLGLQALVAAPYVALSVVPAWRASNLDPMEALRGG